MSFLRLPGLSFFTLLLFPRRCAHTDGDRVEGFLGARYLRGERLLRCLCDFTQGSCKRSEELA